MLWENSEFQDSGSNMADLMTTYHNEQTTVFSVLVDQPFPPCTLVGKYKNTSEETIEIKPYIYH